MARSFLAISEQIEADGIARQLSAYRSNQAGKSGGGLGIPITYLCAIQADELPKMRDQGLLRSFFPLTARLVSSSWVQLTQDYFERHPVRQFHFRQCAREFLSYLTASSGTLKSKFPHLADLADLEYAQLEVSRRSAGKQAGEYVSPRSTDELNYFCPVVNPSLEIRSYSYPMPAIIHRLKNRISLPEKISQATTHMVIYRNPASGAVDLLELSGVVARLVTTARQAPLSYTKLIEMTAPLCRQTDTVEAIVAILELVDKLQDCGIFIGSTRCSSRTDRAACEPAG
jgi:hypothetical protein